jgi:hypothetical protein
MKNYITTKDACLLLGVTRQGIFYLKKHHIIKDFIKVHTTCILYSQKELLTLKSLGYGK